jgi:hypothetical protein
MPVSASLLFPATALLIRAPLTRSWHRQGGSDRALTAQRALTWPQSESEHVHRASPSSSPRATSVHSARHGPQVEYRGASLSNAAMLIVHGSGIHRTYVHRIRKAKLNTLPPGLICQVHVPIAMD